VIVQRPPHLNSTEMLSSIFDAVFAVLFNWWCTYHILIHNSILRVLIKTICLILYAPGGTRLRFICDRGMWGFEG
jgi:hypothetical protein